MGELVNGASSSEKAKSSPFALLQDGEKVNFNRSARGNPSEVNGVTDQLMADMLASLNPKYDEYEPLASSDGGPAVPKPKYPSQKPGQIYSPHLTFGDVGNYLSAEFAAAGKSFGKFFTEGIPSIASKVGNAIIHPIDTFSDAHPLDALEKNGLQLQASARQAALDARNGNFSTAGELEGTFIGSSFAGTALGVGTGLVVSRSVSFYKSIPGEFGQFPLSSGASVLVDFSALESKTLGRAAVLFEEELQFSKGSLSGNPAVPPLNANSDMVRAFARQNESAQTLANRGLNVEQLPETGVPGGNPDLKVNGNLADVYAPTSKNVKTVADTIAYKVQQQAPNVVINLNDTVLTSTQIIQHLQANPVPGLNSVHFIRKDVVTVVRY